MALFLSRHWKQRPQGLLEINWAHPLSYKLMSVCLPGYRYDLTRPSVPWDLYTVPQGIVIGTYGPAIKAGDSDTSIASIGRDSFYERPSTQVTVFYFGRPADPGSVRLRTLMGKEGTSVGYPRYALKLDNGFSSNDYINYVVQSSAGNISGINDSVLGSVTSYYEKDIKSSLSYNSSIGVAQAFFNGSPTYSTTLGTGTISYAGTASSGEGRYFGVSSQSGLYYMTASWTKGLSDSEQQLLHENPWQILKPQKKIIYSLPISYSRPVLDNTNNNQLNRVVGGTASLAGGGAWGRFLPQRWRQQPQKPVDINWNNPLSNNLKGILCANLIPPGVTYRGTLAFTKTVSTRYGSYIATTGNNSGYITISTPSGWSTGTFAMLGSLPQTYPNRFIGMSGGEGGNTVFGFQQPFSTYGNKLIGGLRLTQDGATSTVTSLTYPNTTDDPTKVHLWVVVYDGTANLNLYIDGKLDTGIQSGTASGTAGGISNLSLSGTFGGGAAVGGAQNIMNLFWPRALSPAEIQELANNPWQIFESRTRTIYVPPSGWTRIP